MKESDIRKYAGLMEELGLTGLEITEDNRVVRLERSVPVEIRETLPVPARQEAPVQTAQPAAASGSEVKSPMVGVFYAGPAENAEPYVSVGDTVKKGQTLCIVEAMKLMNEITAEEDGVISQICVTDGQVVEYGTTLFCMQKGA